MSGALLQQDSLVNDGKYAKVNASLWSGYINIVNTIVGAGALVLPLVVKESGVAGGILLILLVGSFSLYSQRMIVSACMSAFDKPATFSHLGTKTFGSKGHIYSELCIILFLMGGQVSYLIVIGDLLTPLLLRVGIHVGTDTKETYIFITSVIAVVVILPLSSCRSLDSLKFTSFIALFFIICLCIGVLVKSIRGIIIHGVDPSFYWFTSNWNGIFISLPIVNFAFTFHPSVPHVWGELRDPSPRNINFISFLSVISCGILYSLLGVFGYMYRYEKTLSNILLQYYDDPLFVGIQLGYSLVIIFSYPVLNYATRNGIDSILCKRKPVPIQRYIIESVFILVITLVIAIVLPKLEFVLGFIGSTVGQLVIFINPALFYLKLDKPEDVLIKGERGGIEEYIREEYNYNYSWKNTISLRKLPAILLIIFGLVCGTVSVIVSVQKLINEGVPPII